MKRALPILLLLVLAACSAPSEPEATDAPTPADTPIRTIEVELGEWSILPSPEEADAGEVTFAVANTGEKPHELHVIASDADPHDLPTNDDGSADLDDMPHGDHVEELQSGTSEEITVDLQPGTYLLVCNLVDGEDVHYELGMRTQLEVT